ncbi:MAG: acyltransferase [Halothiobacillus sp.]|jgi:acetyltransferase-like isoleucine patch superfamily enzyme|nr:acyltransferase [Halothiobacillus sp.]
MAYLSETQLREIGFRRLGKNVKISDKTSIYNPELIELGDNSRIDDFCVVSGRVVVGQYCHITPMCLVAGGVPGILISDFCTLAYGVKIFAQSDDYSGLTLTNSLIPKKYKSEIYKSVSVGRHVIIGAGSVVFPGVHIAEGCSVGAMTLVNKSTLPWGVYVGNPARRVKERKKDLLELEKKFLEEIGNDPL